MMFEAVNWPGYARFDRNGDGKLDAAELQQLILANCPPFLLNTL